MKKFQIEFISRDHDQTVGRTPVNDVKSCFDDDIFADTAFEALDSVDVHYAFSGDSDWCYDRHSLIPGENNLFVLVRRSREYDDDYSGDGIYRPNEDGFDEDLFEYQSFVANAVEVE